MQATLKKRAWNFSAGPSALPDEVVEQIKEALPIYGDDGVSIMEMSHRGKTYKAVHQETLDNFKELLEVPDTHEVVMVQGGATGQFAMIPLNLLGAGQSADYTNSGAWADKAIKEAKAVGNVNVVFDTSKDIPTYLPELSTLQWDENAAYAHITSNETIAGTQWKTFPNTPSPLVADMSSDILSRKINVSDFGLIYAGSQKNLGPAGVTFVVIRKDLADKAPETVPGFLRYDKHIDQGSMLNTPPCFSIYVVGLVLKWLKAQGGVEAIEKHNEDKAAVLYDAIDASSFYTGTAKVENRSLMNVTFTLPNEDLEAQFVKEADAQNLKTLKGHRSVGGIRASIYNAMPKEGVQALVDFMKDFEQKNG